MSGDSTSWEGWFRQAEALRASGEPVPVIAATLGVSRVALYRTLAEEG
jgi:hypothetical protein